MAKKLTVQMVIDRLTEMVETDSDIANYEVRLMTQQNWPFENHLTGTVLGYEMIDDDDDDDSDELGEEEREERKSMREVLYFVEGGQIRYGNKAAWNQQDTF